MKRVQERLADLGRNDPQIEMQFSMPDQWSRQLFTALVRRYGLTPYRFPRQRHKTVMIRVPQSFVNDVLWPEFRELNQALRSYLNEVTLRIIHEEIYADASDAQEVLGVLALECNVIELKLLSIHFARHRQ